MLRDVYEREYAANYDARYGTPGAYARKLAASAEWEAGREERERKAQEQAEAEELAYLNMLKNESPEAKRTREKAEARAQRESERRSKAYRGRRYSYKPDNTDYVAYSAGAKAGDKISIDSQIDSSSRKGIE